MRRLARALDYAEGFWLGFTKCNSPAQRRKLVEDCRVLLQALKLRLLEIELTEPITDLLPVIREHLARAREGGDSIAAPQTDKLAIFVYGLEHSIPSREAYPPLLSSLNLGRELFREQFPHPLVLWLPDYALTALARKAPDFWAWRSGLYEFAPERELVEQSFKAVISAPSHRTRNLLEPSKRQRLVMLKGLLDDYTELGDGPHERGVQADILLEIGLLHMLLGESAQARQAGEEALAIQRNLNREAGVALALYLLSTLERSARNYEEALRLSSDSLEIYRKLDDLNGVSAMLHMSGSLACLTGDNEEARRLYSESLAIARRLSDQRGIAANLHELAFLAEDSGEPTKARQLYTESLEISKALNDQFNSATTLGQLGRMAEKEGDLTESARLYREALRIFKELGSPYAMSARQDLERVEDTSL